MGTKILNRVPRSIVDKRTRVERSKQGLCYLCGDRGYYLQIKAWLCKKHYRLQRMRMSCVIRKLYRPSYEELEALLPADMICESCGGKMVWTARENTVMVISIQHDRSGQIRLICKGCNSAHAQYPGDSYYEQNPHEKQCRKCGITKSVSEFYKSKTDKIRGVSSKCKTCADRDHAQYVKDNREKMNAYQRERRVKTGNVHA